MPVRLLSLALITFYGGLGCGAELSTSQAQALEAKVCACTQPACARQIVPALKDMSATTHRFEDANAAKSALAAAIKCALQLDPELKSELSRSPGS